MRKSICFFLYFLLFLSLFTVSALSEDTDSKILSQLNGKWEGSFPVDVKNNKDMKENVIMNFVNGENSKLLLTFKNSGIYYWNIDSWKIENNTLIFSFNDDEWKAIVLLNLKEKDTLNGFYIQYGEVIPVTLNKISNKPENKEFYQENVIEGHNLKEWISYLKKGNDYKFSDKKIPYKYTLNEREKYNNIIEKYNLDEILKGKDDTEKMISLLYFVSDNFKHNGSIGMPEKTDANSLIKFYEQKGGLSCRGLSILLSELLRAYGIPAKHITCMPPTENFYDCHVVVHAYSEKLGKWILLDPTYKLYLKDKNGSFINLPELRNCIINETNLISNESAGWNGNEFDMEYYKTYMAKNTYRFECATDFYYGTDTNTNNKQNMLVPVGYRPKETYAEITNNDKEFWKPPY